MVRTKSPFLEPSREPVSFAGPVDEVAGAAGERPRAGPRAGPRSRRPWPRTASARRRGPATPPRATSSRSCTPLNPSAISWRNWWSGEPSRVGSSSWATFDRSPSKYWPSRPPMRPIAESRRVSSNSSLTNCCSSPRSPRNFSSVRGSRPSPSAKLARSTSSTARAACSLTAVVWATSFSNSRRTTSTSTAVAASWRASRPIRRARSTTAGRSPGSRSASDAARTGSARTSRSTTIRSPSTRTWGAVSGRLVGSGVGVGSGRIRASMPRILGDRCDT